MIDGVHPNGKKSDVKGEHLILSERDESNPLLGYSTNYVGEGWLCRSWSRGQKEKG